MKWRKLGEDVFGEFAEEYKFVCRTEPKYFPKIVRVVPVSEDIPEDMFIQLNFDKNWVLYHVEGSNIFELKRGVFYHG